GDATVSLTAVSISTTGFCQPLVNNTNGVIGGNASVMVGVAGDINVGDAFFNLLNDNGTIGGQAAFSLAANNFTSENTFQFQIANDGGSIGSSASLTANLSGSLVATGAAFTRIFNLEGT